MRLTSHVFWYPDIGSLDDARLASAQGGVLDAIADGVAHLPSDSLVEVSCHFGNGTMDSSISVESDSIDPDTVRRSFQGLQRHVGLEPWEPTVKPSTAGATRLQIQVQGSGRRDSTIGRWPALSGFWSAIAPRLAMGNEALELTVRLRKTSVSRTDLTMAQRRLERISQREGHSAPEVRTALQGLRESVGLVQVQMLLRGSQNKAALLAVALQGAATADCQGQYFARTSVPGDRDEIAAPTEQRIRALLAGDIVNSRTMSTLVPIPVLSSAQPLQVARRSITRNAYTPHVRAAGSLLLGRTDAGEAFRFPVQDLAQHLLVTGLTGFGKSTTVRSMLQQLWDDLGVPFLVVDPLKDDYADMVLSAPTGDPASGTRRRVRRMDLGNNGLRINPLAVPDGVDSASFASVLVECFDSATRLSETFPLGLAVLRNAVQNLYSKWAASGESQGWPTLAHLYAEVLAEVHKETTHTETANALRLSLTSRIESLLTGANADILSGGPTAGIRWEELLSIPTVLSLGAYDDNTSRSTAFAFILAGLIAYRRRHPAPPASHVAVLEEAHMVLGSSNESAASAVAEALATQRSLGQAYILVSQVPRHLPDLVFDLFPSRLTHRLAAGEGLDRVAAAMGVTDPSEIAGLRCGEALVVNANGYFQGTRLIIDRPVNEHEPAPAWVRRDVVEATPPERIWCSRCPAPCTGTQWLDVLPKVLAGEVGATTDSLQDRAIRIARKLLVLPEISTRSEDLSEAAVRVRLYCTLSRGLTLLTSYSDSQARQSQDVARSVADGISASLTHRRAHPNAPRVSS
ncbi:helicase HerA-like domain-containing protein [Kribbella sp. NPDC000426]|uniref:ATP-binding protein n=1 Tax=Kribbella sp. NPDC000426 TaxID=3154255 RepID=UPI00331F3608